MLYRLVRPWLFRLEAEQAHRWVMKWSGWVERLPVSWCQRAHSPRLSQRLWGVEFASPVGLAAGMDKNAERLGLWQLLGFGFVEIGSVTARPALGNPQPRLFRLPEDQALINRMGLNNEGALRIARRLAQRPMRPGFPIGVNIAKTHDPAIMEADAVADFVESYERLAPLAAYVTLNISCPNTTEGKTFEEPTALDGLLSALQPLRLRYTVPPPLLVKLSPPPLDWRPDGQLDELLSLLSAHQVDGLVISNTASDRAGLQTPAEKLAEMGRGGLSGRPLHPRALSLLRAVYAKTEGRLPLIGVGGIDSAAAAYAMIRAGASLIQLFTGLIYQGPGLLRKIHDGLLRKLDEDRLEQLQEAVGADVSICGLDPGG